MKIFITTGAILLSSLTISLHAQKENKTNLGNSSFSKRIEPTPSTDKTTSKESVSKQKSEDLANPEERVAKTSSNKLSTPTPATKTSSSHKMTSIEYSLDNNNSALTNLLNLIEIKEKVNQPENENLTGSDQYKTLLKDIASLRSEFDAYVEAKGIENCSSTEKSYYLAFLKEEGNEEAYQEAMKNLK